MHLTTQTSYWDNNGNKMSNGLSLLSFINHCLLEPWKCIVFHIKKVSSFPQSHFRTESLTLLDIQGCCWVASSWAGLTPIYLNWIFSISGLKYQVWWTGFFFLVWNQKDIFHVQTDLFSSFRARVKYFDVPCLTLYSLPTIYRDIHYQFWVWWIHHSHCYTSKR